MTVNLNLIPLLPELASLLADDNPAVRGFLGPRARAVSAVVRDVARLELALYESNGAVAPWIGYLCRDASSDEIVGSCSFKDACRDGQVEIAYFTFPGYEGRGYATAMARQLVVLAWQAPECREILAHTLPTESPSTRLLRRLEFACLGEVDDPEDGRIWRWRLRRP